ncbi:MAG: hypothetical protein WB783_01320 [Arenicellales bacterium]
MKTPIGILVALGLAVLLAGCYRSSDVTIHEPGVYKGNTDPLLKGDANARDAKLADRFNLVQKDR